TPVRRHHGASRSCRCPSIRSSVLLGCIYQRLRGHGEIRAQLLGVSGPEAVQFDHVLHRTVHVTQPRIAFTWTDDKGCMSHAKPRMTPLLVVRRWAAPILHKEERQMPSRFCEVIGVQRPEERVPDNSQVEMIDQIEEELLTAHPVKEYVHGNDGRRSRLLPDSRP